MLRARQRKPSYGQILMAGTATRTAVWVSIAGVALRAIKPEKIKPAGANRQAMKRAKIVPL